MPIRKEKKERIRRAMPDVQALVAKYGAKTISICLFRLSRHETALKRIGELKRQTDALEKQVFG